MECVGGGLHAYIPIILLHDVHEKLICKTKVLFNGHFSINVLYLPLCKMLNVYSPCIV